MLLMHKRGATELQKSLISWKKKLALKGFSPNSKDVLLICHIHPETFNEVSHSLLSHFPQMGDMVLVFLRRVIFIKVFIKKKEASNA